MIPRTPGSTLTDTLCPYTTLFRSQRFEYGALHLRPVDTDGAPAQLGAIEHHVVGARQCAFRIAFQLFGIALGHGERMVQCVVTPAIFLERSEEHTSELQSLMSISYAVFCL